MPGPSELTVPPHPGLDSTVPPYPPPVLCRHLLMGTSSYTRQCLPAHCRMTCFWGFLSVFCTGAEAGRWSRTDSLPVIHWCISAPTTVPATLRAANVGQMNWGMACNISHTRPFLLGGYAEYFRCPLTLKIAQFWSCLVQSSRSCRTNRVS